MRKEGEEEVGLLTSKIRDETWLVEKACVVCTFHEKYGGRPEGRGETWDIPPGEGYGGVDGECEFVVG
jgi:hypothetical protein